MTDQQQFANIRALALAQLEQVRSEMKPTYWVDGQRVHWEQYAESLQRTIDWCDTKLVDGEPYEVQSRGTS